MRHPKGKALVDKLEYLTWQDLPLTLKEDATVVHIQALFAAGDRIPAEDVREIEKIWEKYGRNTMAIKDNVVPKETMRGPKKTSLVGLVEKVGDLFDAHEDSGLTTEEFVVLERVDNGFSTKHPLAEDIRKIDAMWEKYVGVYL